MGRGEGGVEDRQEVYREREEGRTQRENERETRQQRQRGTRRKRMWGRTLAEQVFGCKKIIIIKMSTLNAQLFKF